MKTLFSFLLAAILLTAGTAVVSAVANDAKAQLVTVLVPTAADDTLTNTDTADIYIGTGAGSNTSNTVDNIGRAATLEITRLSGTLGGTAVLQGLNGTLWESIGSAYTVTNSATQVITFPLRNANGDLLYKQFRVRVLPTGTQTCIPKVYYHRRSN